MKVVPTQEAIGMVLCHDLTRIVPGQEKGPAFRKGHVVQTEDIPLLLSMGKEHLYVWEVQPGMIHEEEAAQRLAKAGVRGGIEWGAPREGKVTLKAAHSGLLRVDIGRLEEINGIDEVTIAALRDRTAVTAGQTLAGCKVTPLTIDERKIALAETVGNWIEVKPYRPRPAAIIVTGSEVAKGRIEDKFGPVVAAKLAAFDCPVVYREVSGDDPAVTAGMIAEAVTAGAEIICCTGGMSVDPDDATPGAIRRSGAEIVTYGVPVLPGSMFMMGYLDGGRVVMGLPGAVMWEHLTSFDLVLPVVLADERLTKRDFVRLGHGGLLQNHTC